MQTEMQTDIREEYFRRLFVAESSADPTIPFDNEFHLLGLDETESDLQIAEKAKATADKRSYEVDQRGKALMGKGLDIMLRTKITQAGMRFNGQPTNVAKHREQLHRLRERRLKDFAKALCDSGKWTAKQGTDMLETVASTIGVAPDRLRKAVSGAVLSAGQWLPDSGDTPAHSGSTPPLPGPTQVVVDSFAIGSKTIPLWAVIPPIGLALGLVNAWAGLTFGLSFLVLALGKAQAERNLKVPATTRHLQWGALNAAITSLPLLALLILQPGADAPGAKWAGEWETDWGRMTFSAKSNGVTAQYESPTGSGKVDLKTTNERQLDGSWCRGSCAPPNDTGQLRLVLDESGQTFKGWYTNGDSEVKQGDDPAYQVNGRRKARR